MISREQLDHWQALADAATPGPWEYLDVAGYAEVYQAPAAYDGNTVFSDTPQGAENAKFTAAAREAVPALIAEVKELQSAIKEWRAANKLLEHKVITCGVAAHHSDPNLTRTGAYADKWNSPQAEDVRKLRDKAEAQAKEIERLRDVLARVVKIEQRRTYNTCLDCDTPEVCKRTMQCTVASDTEELCRAALKETP